MRTRGPFTPSSYLQTFSAAAPPELAGRTEARWGVKAGDGRDIVCGLGSLDEAIAEAARLTADEQPVVVHFASGNTRTVLAHTARVVVGLDAEGDLVAESPDLPGMRYLLTSCCHGSGKGADVSTGVVCRGCYAEVDAAFGGYGTVTDPVVR